MYRLLVVDDEKDIRENIRYLIDWGEYGINQIETAATYEEAVNKALDMRPHIILMDVKLGDDQWGYDLAERLRACGLKTVCGMISGYDEFAYVQRSMQASARDYLLKPIDVEQLKSFVERAIVEELKGEVPRRKIIAPDVDPVLKVEYGKLSRITNKIIMIVKENYRSSLSLVGIGEMFCMSSKYIGRIFLQDTGMKFSEYLMAYRMVQARKLIETTGDKIAVIAGQTGYTQLNNFYVHFKEYYGFSPSALRGAGKSVPEAERNADEAGVEGGKLPGEACVSEAGEEELPGEACASEAGEEELPGEACASEAGEEELPGEACASEAGEEELSGEAGVSEGGGEKLPGEAGTEEGGGGKSPKKAHTPYPGETGGIYGKE